MPSFFYYVLNLSTILVHSITLPVHQPFGTVMEKSGVETRSSEQTMLSDEAHVLLVTDSSSEEDSETDDQSYPPQVHALTYAMPCCLGKRHICELYHAVLFCISHCFCRQCLYIQLLFLCISHLNW